MREYLEESEYCDWRHPAIAEIAGTVRENNGTDRATAVALFDFVRDEVRYRFGPWSIAASQTLETRGGMCTTKANLLVALFRSAGIPAAYGILRVDAGVYFGDIGLPTIVTGRSNSVHVYAAAWLGDRWVRCDPSTDRALSEKSAHFCRQTTLAVWDGVRDRMDYIDPEHIHADLGLSPHPRELFEKRPSRRMLQDSIMFNYYLDFLRSRPAFDSADEAFVAMFEHARGAAPEMWALFTKRWSHVLATHGPRDVKLQSGSAQQ